MVSSDIFSYVASVLCSLRFASSVLRCWSCFTTPVRGPRTLQVTRSNLCPFGPLLCFRSALVLVQIQILLYKNKWSVLTSLPMQHLLKAASVQASSSLLNSSLCQSSFVVLHRILVVQAFALSVCLALHTPFWSTLVLAHILLHEWSVLTSFPMRHLPQPLSKLVGPCSFLPYVKFSLECYIKFS